MALEMVSYAQDDDGITHIRLADPCRFDQLITTELDDRLERWLSGSPSKRLVVDFDRVTRISASVINSMVALSKRVDGFGGTLLLSGVNRNIRDVFRLLKLDGTILDFQEPASDTAN